MKTLVTVKLQEDKKEKTLYPYYGEHKSGTIVLFNAFTRGVCIRTGINENEKEINYVGEYRADWLEESFTPIIGIITIEQKK